MITCLVSSNFCYARDLLFKIIRINPLIICFCDLLECLKLRAVSFFFSELLSFQFLLVFLLDSSNLSLSASVQASYLLIPLRMIHQVINHLNDSSNARLTYHNALSRYFQSLEDKLWKDFFFWNMHSPAWCLRFGAALFSFLCTIAQVPYDMPICRYIHLLFLSCRHMELLLINDSVFLSIHYLYRTRFWRLWFHGMRS